MGAGMGQEGGQVAGRDEAEGGARLEQGPDGSIGQIGVDQRWQGWGPYLVQHPLSDTPSHNVVPHSSF